MKVGDTVVWVPHEKRNPPVDVTITKIGRKYATLSNDLRVDLKTLGSRDWFTQGRIYLSRAEYDTALAAKNAWTALNNAMGYAPPPGITAADIKAARKLLGV